MAYITPSPKITTYLVDGSWTIDPRTTIVEFYGWGGGGGGGSGRNGASGATTGGAGGGAGSFYYLKSKATDLTSSPYTVTIGTGGAGGALVNGTNVTGNPGIAGNPTSVGSIFIVKGGTAGGGGSTGTLSTPSEGFNILGLTTTLAAGGQSSASSGNTDGTDLRYAPATGGGPGASYNTTTARAGSIAGNITDGADNILVAGGTAGSTSGGNGGNGNPPGTQTIFTIGGTGGGGGGHDNTTIAGSGGNGAQPGGGGGGGAGNLSLNNSGAGGNGANGKVIIIEYF